MQTYPFRKSPAFFPFVSAEVFFEATEADKTEVEKATVDDKALDAELDKILGLVEIEE